MLYHRFRSLFDSYLSLSTLVMEQSSLDILLNNSFWVPLKEIITQVVNDMRVSKWLQICKKCWCWVELLLIHLLKSRHMMALSTAIQIGNAMVDPNACIELWAAFQCDSLRKQGDNLKWVLRGSWTNVPLIILISKLPFLPDGIS